MLFSLSVELLKNLQGQDLAAIQQNIIQEFPQYKSGEHGIDQLIDSKAITETDYIKIIDLLPLWLRDRNENSSINPKLNTILQKYYDWLYSENGSQYILDDRFADIKDIDAIPDVLVPYIVSTYSPSIESIVDILDPDKIRNFLSNIKERVYNKKGTAEAAAYFFKTLIGADSVQYGSTGTGYTLTIFFQQALPEENFNKIVDVFLSTLHPVGLNYNITQDTTTDNSSVAFLGGGGSGGHSGDIPQFTVWEELTYGDGAYDGTGTGEEISIIGNYFPYTLGDTLDIVATAGCSGATVHGGISGGATGNRANMVTYSFPDWATAVPISGSSFGLINTYDFAFLNAASGNTSPNDDREDNHTCPIGGFTY
jgi:hypothetical protein